MTVEPFPLSFQPAHQAVELLATVANDPASPHRQRAEQVLKAWREALATPEQIARVETSDDLEVDDNGACVSPAQDGLWVQAWTWVEARTDG